MEIKTNFSLKNFNTFHVDALAKQFVSVENESDLKSLLQQFKNCKKLILGGGSNLLLTKNVDDLVIHVNLKEKKIVKRDENHVWVSCAAGENWHEFVLWTLFQNFGGLENMSLIPGSVGATPVQNIGAYGAEIKDTMDWCTAIHIENQEEKIFFNADCKFAYRESIFKNEVKNQFIITSVVFKLTTKNHKINTDYGDILKELTQQNIQNPSINEVSNAVVAIRKSKLPDPNELGNSGSFFKNPILLRTDFEPIVQKFPEMKFYNISETEVKVPAGWLIEQAGLKGKRFGDAGIHKNQALVLVNYGNATGKDNPQEPII